MFNTVIGKKSLLKFVINMHFIIFTYDVMHIGKLRINFNEISIFHNFLSLFPFF